MSTGIAEWYSPVVPGSGLHPRPGSAESLKEFFSEVDPLWETVAYPSRKGETVEELHNRIDALLPAFASALAQRLPLEKRKKVLLVSHAATVIALLRSLLGDRELPMKVGCCSLSIVDGKTGTDSEGDVEKVQMIGAYKPVMLVSGDHLTGGSSREWGFEDIEVDKGRVGVVPGPLLDSGL